MPRIIGVDIPREKKTDVALTYLYGIGLTTSRKILKAVNIDPTTRAKDLTDKDVSNITTEIQKSCVVEGDLRRQTQQNVRRLIDIRSYRGSRHVKGLPVNGQRTHTNSRTRKGPRVAVGGLSKKPPSPK